MCSIVIVNRCIEHDTLYVRMLLYYNYYDSTKRILGCATVSRKEHAISQTRELEATKAVLPQVLEQGGIFHVFM